MYVMLLGVDCNQCGNCPKKGDLLKAMLLQQRLDHDVLASCSCYGGGLLEIQPFV